MRPALALFVLSVTTFGFSQAPASQATQAAPKAGDPRQTAPSLAAQVPSPRPDEVKSPEALVAACYQVISGPAGTRDWAHFRSLFLPTARLSASSQRPDGSHVVTLLSVGDYVHLAGAHFEKESFFESSLHNEVRSFGNVAQIFSSYTSRHAPAEQPFARGINSFQLLFDGQRWWIVSILWDEERKDNPLPANMLDK